MKNLIGLPYADFDCYQLVCKASLELYNKRLPEIQDYIAYPAEKVDEQRLSIKWREIPEPELGCIVVLGKHDRYARHVGLWVGEGVLHATRAYGSVIQDHFQLLAAGYPSQRYFVWEG
jgi:hypothetical protein